MGDGLRLEERDPCGAGREALTAGAWQDALRHFEQAVSSDPSAEALEGLSWAAWWVGGADATLAARERAYRAHRAAGDPCGAARMAVWLANDSLDFHGDDAVSAGWLERARRLLDGEQRCPEHGWLMVLDGYYALNVRGDAEAGLACGRDAAALGAELGVADLEALGRALEGDALVTSGEIAAGMRRLDEAAALASGERFELPISPAFTQCILISACEKAGDFARVAQWCKAMRALGEQLDGRHVIGVCRSAYGSVLAARGEWAEAEAELTDALVDLEATRPGLAPAGLVRLGELRLRQGRGEEARLLFQRARPNALAETGLATLALQEGDARGAAEAAERTLRRIGASTPLDRLPPLELLVRSRARLGEFGAAAAALAELERLGGGLPTPYLNGRGRLAGGELALARGDAEAARPALEDAADLFLESSAPYEAALARLALAEALGQLGRGEAARAEAQVARETFEALGAAADSVRAGELLGAERAPAAADRGGGDGARSDALTPREREVLRLVAEGMSDAEIAERLVLSPHTVHRHVANVRTKLRLPSRAAAVAYATREGLL